MRAAMVENPARRSKLTTEVALTNDVVEKRSWMPVFRFKEGAFRHGLRAWQALDELG